MKSHTIISIHAEKIFNNLLKLMYRFHANSIKIPAKYLADIDKIILKSIWKGKGTGIAKTILKKKTKVELLYLFSRLFM